MSRWLSVVVNTLDRADVLGDALSGLRQQRHSCFEVIVVNGPSADATEAVLDRFPWIRRGRCAEANLARSRNIGLAMARGEIVAFLDDDAVPEPGWLQGLEAGYASPRIGGVGGFIRDATGLAYQARITVCDRLGQAFGFDGLAQARAALHMDPGRFLSPTGANVSYRRDALLAIGGFDETFAYFLDETDVNLRLQEAGWAVTFVQGAEVHHRLAANAQRDARNVPRSLYRQCRSQAYFALRHSWSWRADSEVLEALAEHGLSLRDHNHALMQAGLIDPAHRAELDRQVQVGLRDGLTCALLPRSPPRLTGTILAEHRGGRFKPVPPPGRTCPKPLRLAFVSRQYPPGVVGGIGVWTHTAARALAARGHEVSVITTADAPSLAFEEGVWVHRLAPTHAPDRLTPPLPDLPQAVRDHAYAVLDAVRGLQAQRGLDLVSWPIWDLEGLAVQSAGDIATVVSLHTTYALAATFKPDWRDSTFRRAHVDRIIGAESALLASAPRLLANSAQLLIDLEAACGVNLRRPGVATLAHGLADRTVFRSAGADGRVRMLFVGRLERRKGVEVLLEALALVVPQHPQIDVRLIGERVDEGGDGPVEAFFRRRGAWRDRVVVEGPVTRDRLDRAYAECDVFVAPSLYESFGLVFVEAMMFAKPCVGCRVGGVAEVVIDGETGLLTPPGNPTALAAALTRLINDAGLRLRMGAAGRARYLAEFTDTRMAGRLEAMFREVVAEASEAVLQA